MTIEFSKYQRDIFDWVVNGRGDAVVQAVAGCLSGDTMIGINRAGKSSQIKLDQLVHLMNGGRRGTRSFNPSIPTKVRSLIEPEHKIIGLNEVALAIYSGEKFTYAVKTKGGFKVRATADHRFLTDTGWRKLQDLRVGDLLLTDAGKPKKSALHLAQKNNSSRQGRISVGDEGSHYTALHLAQKKIGEPCVEVTGEYRGSFVNGSPIFFKPSFGIIFKASSHQGYKPHYRRMFGLINHPYNHSDGRKGHVWLHRLIAEARLNEMSLEDFVTRIKKGETESLQFLDPSVWVVHHIDGDWSNNDPDNLQVMTLEEHQNHHALDRGWRYVQSKVALDPIKSIEEYGFEATYDLTMVNEQCPNFLANGIVVHNSGKTFTLVEAAKLLKSDRAVFLAFNKHIAQQLQARLGSSMVAKTIHSVGLATLRGAIRKPIVDDSKYGDIGKVYAQEIANDLKRDYAVELRRWARGAKDTREPEEPLSAGQVLSQLKQLVHYTRVTLINEKDFDDVEEMVQHFGCLDSSLDLKQLHYPLMSILREGQQIADREGIIDYDDMLWLPYCWNLEPSKCDWVAVDEAQDVSPAQLDLILKMRGRGGRMIWVGDKFQAVFGFAGAMSDSIDRIIAATYATVLPLSICYRCPTSHIKLAKEIVPSIEAAPGAIEGIVEYISYDKVQSIIAEGDLIISRCTAPVIKLCIELIAKKIPARVRGRDIGKALTAIVREVATMPSFDFEKFGYALQAYQYDKITKLQQKKSSESQIESLRDRISGIWVCYVEFNSDNILDFCAEIEELFSDRRSSVVLSTVHRAKGLQERRVFILRPDQLPLTWRNQLPWQKEQEKNLEYVAKTRALEALFFVTDEKPIEVKPEVAARYSFANNCLHTL